MKEELTSEVWKIYVASFPVVERRKVEAYESVCAENPEFKPEVVYINDEVAGLMFHWDTEAFSYLEHFAVRSDLRNRGEGGKLLDAYLAGHSRVVLEVEPPENEICRRRIAFYERHGLTFSGVAFTHPGYETDENGLPTPYTLYLMTRPAWTREECASFLKFLSERVLKKDIFE